GRNDKSRPRSVGSKTDAAKSARRQAICRGGISGWFRPQGFGKVSTLVKAPLVLHMKAARAMHSRPPTGGLPAPSLAVMEHLADAPVEDGHHLVDLLSSDDQRRPKGEPMWIETAQEAIVQRTPADTDAEGQLSGEAFLRGWVADELDPLEQALSADVADDAVLLCQSLEPGPQPLSLSTGVGAQVALQDFVQHG